MVAKNLYFSHAKRGIIAFGDHLIGALFEGVMLLHKCAVISQTLP